MYHSWRVRPLQPSVARSPKVALGGMLQIASVVVYIIFLFEGRKMSISRPYRGHKIRNVFCGLGLTFSISRPIYGPQKFILRPEDKNSTLYTKDAKCIILAECDLRSEAAKGDTRRDVTDCVRGSIYNFFVRRPQNEYFAACIESTKYEMYFAA